MSLITPMREVTTKFFRNNDLRIPIYTGSKTFMLSQSIRSPMTVKSCVKSGNLCQLHVQRLKTSVDVGLVSSLITLNKFVKSAGHCQTN